MIYRSQDIWVQIFRKSGVGVTKCHFPKAQFNYQQVPPAFFFFLLLNLVNQMSQLFIQLF